MLTIDFETYYSKDFGLTKLTTEEYIRSPLFQVIGVAVKRDEEPPVWFSGTHEEIKAFLDGYNIQNQVVLAHNSLFDMAILNWIFDIRPKRIFDTLMIARLVLGPNKSVSLKNLALHYNIGVKGTEVVDALGKRREHFLPRDLYNYGEYCKNDTDLTYTLFIKLLESGKVPAIELQVMDITCRMFSEPVLEIDKDLLHEYINELVAEKEDLMSRVTQERASLMSNPQFAETLRNYGVEPPTKISLTTGKETYAFAKTDEGMKQLLEHENLAVQALVAARMGVKSTMAETRAERFLAIAGRGTLPIPLKYGGAHTLRWSGMDKINLQNLVRGSKLKKALKAPDGYLLIDCDSSQIEARVLAWLAGQQDLVDQFARGEDIYVMMASEIYNVPHSDVQKPQRFVGKQTILGCGYGMGADRFQAQLKSFDVYVSLEESQKIIATYRGKMLAIKRFWKLADDAIAAMVHGYTTTLGPNELLKVRKGGIDFPDGTSLEYQNIQQDTATGEYTYESAKYKAGASIKTKIYGGKLVENICQKIARGIVAYQMALISKKLKVVLTVHDSVVALSKEEDVKHNILFIENCMRTVPDWAQGAPVNCESEHGKMYR